MSHGTDLHKVKTYHEIDLRKIKEEMGEHWTPHNARQIRDYCDCGERVTQDVLDCPSCGVRIIWYGSRVWKDLYGSPDVMVQQLTVRPPTDDAGVYLFEKATLTGFNSQTDEASWKTANRWFTQAELISTIDHAYGTGSRRHGLVRHVLAITNKQGRERRDLKRRKPKGNVDPQRIPERPE